MSSHSGCLLSSIPTNSRLSDVAGTARRSADPQLHCAVPSIQGNRKRANVFEYSTTDAHEADASVGARIVQRLPKSVRKVMGDGAYDTRLFRVAVQKKGATPWFLQDLQPFPFILCHSDLHAGNLLLEGEGAFYLIN